MPETIMLHCTIKLLFDSSARLDISILDRTNWGLSLAGFDRSSTERGARAGCAFSCRRAQSGRSCARSSASPGRRPEHLSRILLEAGLARERPDVRSGDSEDSETRVGRPGILVEIDGDGAFFLGAYVGVNWIVVLAIDLAGTVRARVSSDFSRRRQRASAAAAEPFPAWSPRSSRKLPPGSAPVRAQRRRSGLSRRRRGHLPRSDPWLARGQSRALSPRRARVSTFRFCWRMTPTPLPSPRRIGAARKEDGTEDSLVVLIENGVGGGIVSGGGLHRGQLLGAGEIGHIPIGDEGFVYDALRPGRLGDLCRQGCTVRPLSPCRGRCDDHRGRFARGAGARRTGRCHRMRATGGIGWRADWRPSRASCSPAGSSSPVR